MQREEKEFKQIVQKYDNILILTHKGPDMDAFCSTLLLRQILKEIYPKKKIDIQTRQNPAMKLPNMQEIQIVNKLDSTGYDAILITDAGDLSLCINEDDAIDSSLPIVCIDHHDTYFAKKENTIIINNNMSSATEQVYMLMRNVYGKSFKINEDSATLIQYGIVADTGRFLYDVTTPNSHRVFADASELVAVDLEDFAYRTSKFPREATAAIIEYLKSLTIEKDMAYMFIDRILLEENLELKQGASTAQSFLRDKYLRFIQGVHWGFIIKPDNNEPDTWFVSFRSTKGYQDVKVIAEELGGGGHTYSAGVIIKENTLNKVLEKVLEVCRKYL